MSGSITINGHERNLSQFAKLSAYIMQDNQLHGNLSVDEAMHVATSLKLGSDLSKHDKKEVVGVIYLYIMYAIPHGSYGEHFSVDDLVLVHSDYVVYTLRV